MSTLIWGSIGAHAISIAHVNACHVKFLLIGFAHIHTTEEVAFGALVDGHRSTIVGCGSRFGVDAVDTCDAISCKANSPVQLLLLAARQLIGGKFKAVVASLYANEWQFAYGRTRLSVCKHQFSGCWFVISIKREGVTFASLCQTQVVGIHTFHCGLVYTLGGEVGQHAVCNERKDDVDILHHGRGGHKAHFLKRLSKIKRSCLYQLSLFQTFTHVEET